MIPPFVVTLVCVSMFAAHAWLAFGHRQKMGADPKDRPQDPLVTQSLIYLTFGTLLTAQAFVLWRRLRMAYGDWHTDTLIERLTDFLGLPASDGLFFAGIAIFLAGIVLRVWAIRILGRLFTFEIGIREGHKIVELGPYRVIRHPSYTGYLLVIIGMSLAYSSLFALIGMSLGAFGFFVLRMNHEERMLKRHFGPAYEEYMKRTKRLFPYIY